MARTGVSPLLQLALQLLHIFGRLRLLVDAFARVREHLLLAACRVTGTVTATYDRVHKRRGGAVRHRRKGESGAEVDIESHGGKETIEQCRQQGVHSATRGYIGSPVEKGTSQCIVVVNEE